MSWKSDKAIERLVRTFQRVKNQIFDQDVEAIKTINETIENSEKSHAVDNILFAKLLCVALRYRTEYYGDIKTALKSIDGDLKTTHKEHVKMLQISLNNVDKLNYLKSISFDLDNENLSKIEELKGNEKEFLEKLKTNWTFENVEKSLVKSVNDFIFNTDNYI